MSGPGLTLTNQLPEGGATVELDDRPPKEIWNALARAGAFAGEIRTCVREIVPDDARPGQRPGILRDLGVTGLHGAYATVVSGFCEPNETKEREVVKDYHPHKVAFDVTAAYGQGETVPHLGVPAPDLLEIRDGPLAVFDAADRTPTVAFRLTDDFRDRRADQRRDVLALVAAVAKSADVRLVGTGVQQQWLAQRHRTDLPGSVSEQCKTGRGNGPGIEDLVDAAWVALDADGRAVSILRSIAEEDTEVRTYASLYAESSVSKDRVRQVVGAGESSLRGLGLVQRVEMSGNTAWELTLAGRAFLDRLDAEIGRQAELSDAVSGGGKSCDDRRVTRDAHGEGIPGSPSAPDHTADSPAGGLPAEEQRRLPDGPTYVEYMSRRNHAAAVSAAPDNGVGVVDTEIEGQTNRHEPRWSYSDTDDHLVVSAEYDNPMAYWVRTALALADGKTFNAVLTPERLDGATDGGSALAGLDVSDTTILRDGRCLGYLKDADASGAAYVDALQQAADHLRTLTKKLANGECDDEASFRGVILREALGLAGTMVHLLDLVGVDVTRECRIPGRFTRNFDTDRRNDLLTTIAKGVAIQSRKGHFSAYRQLFEDREDKRNAAMKPHVDPDDPTGQLIGQFVIVGDGVTQIAPDLRTRLEHPAEIHEDAPEFSVPVTVRSDTPRTATAQTVANLCSAKNLSVTHDAVSVFHAFAGSVYDVARAFRALAPADADPLGNRKIRLDEVRRALASLDVDAILPDVKPSERKIVHALLTATDPLTASEVAARADVSARTFRTYRDKLEQMDLIATTDDGKWRLNLPMADEFADDAQDGVTPWYMVSDKARKANGTDMRSASVRGTLEAMGMHWTMDHDFLTDDVFDGLREECAWVQRWRRLLRALCVEVPPSDPDPDESLATTTATFGEIPDQTSLTNVSA